MERETKTIKTPSGKEIVMKTFLNARERNELRNVFLKEMKIESNTAQVKDEIPASVMDEAEKKLIEVAVISYDGSSENIVDRLLDSAPEEYDFVVAEANKIKSGNFQTAK